ncbi:hypothetical protein LOTGIDRAFT_152008 [Lottia gigantea]|uniref:Sulfotransferase domain-containing protein n=1 Tax=Lottia gigantea TaxID=225164 RepID=V4B421_LOTGI|nr:hypothetical protein LOTGIDRAFT_152008 [Lottia gigantea]ESP05198.1 hypothetical protein LOTGIDRAFT_152008 [Lottia gigantea]
MSIKKKNTLNAIRSILAQIRCGILPFRVETGRLGLLTLGILLLEYTTIPTQAKHAVKFFNGASVVSSLFEDHETVDKATLLGYNDMVYITTTCNKTKNIAYLKVHKCGSTTTANILRRFSMKNDLNTVLMNTVNNYWIFSGIHNLVKIPEGQSFNILDIDSFYDRKLYQKLIPNSPKYLAIMREPVERYISFEFDGSFHGGVFRRNKSNVFMFEDPFKGDPRSLHQQMSVEFGLQSHLRKDENAIRTHLARIDKEFDFVIIHEYFEESLVLMKRLFCWEMSDIISMVSGKNMKKATYALTPSGRHKLEIELKADMIFYNHFRKKLFHTINALGVEFQEEVAQYRYIQRLVKDFCLHGVKIMETIEIPSSTWNKPFTVNKRDCELMLMVEGPMVTLMIKNAKISLFEDHETVDKATLLGYNDMVYITTTCNKTKNIAYLKVHKCGSTTTANILRRFSMKNDLNTVLMNTVNNYWIFSGIHNLVKIPEGQSFNILDIDSFYDRKLYQKLIPNSPKYLAIMREPVERYISFEFDGSFHGGVFRRNKSNVFMFEDPFKGDPRSLHQQMSVEFGLQSHLRKDENAIRTHLARIDKEFDFVIIHEYFEESLVLMKRLFCWEMSDIISMVSGKNMKKATYALTPSGRHKLEIELKADMIFYNHFRKKLFHTINALGVEFQEEVAQYRYIQRLVKDFCLHGVKIMETIEIPSSTWNKPFTVNKRDCELMLMVEGPMVTLMIKNAKVKYENSLKKKS